MTNMRHKRRLFNKNNRVLTIRLPQNVVDLLQNIPQHMLNRALKLFLKAKP